MLRAFRAAASVAVRGGEPEMEPDVAEFAAAIFDLDAALTVGFTVTLGEVSVLEFRALLILREERDRAAETQRQMEAAKQKALQHSRGF